MPRHQEFNTQEALEKAMQVFWRKGYKASSMNDLLSEMGIGKGSFYASFGSKRELFLAALKRYGKKQAMVREAADSLINLPARTAIANIFERIIDRSVNEKRNCMFGNTALEFWQTDSEIAVVVAEGVKQVEAAFYDVVVRGQNNGDIAKNNDPMDLSKFLTGLFYGIQVMASANSDRQSLEKIIVNGLKLLDR